MAVKKWYLTDDIWNTSPWYDNGYTMGVSESAPSTVKALTGWEVHTVTPTKYADMSGQTKVSSTEFGVTGKPILPDDTINAYGVINANGIGITGTFAAGNWTFSCNVIADLSGGDQDGRIRLRLFRSLYRNFDSVGGAAGLHEITSDVVSTSIATNLTTSVAQTLTATLALPEITLNNEYLIFPLAWEITGAAASTTPRKDVVIQLGSSSFLQSTNFSLNYDTDVTINKMRNGLLNDSLKSGMEYYMTRSWFH